MTETIGLLVSISSILVGIAAATTAYLAYRISADAHSLEEYRAVSDWKKDLRAWANSGIAALSDAIYLQSPDAELMDRANEERRCRCVISAIVDQGRLLLPNIPDSHWGIEKAPASRGFRHEALDYLVAAERVISGRLPSTGFPSRSHALDSLRKGFVSSVSQMIDPAGDNRTIAELIRRVHKDREADPTVGGLLPSQHDIPGGAEYVLEIAKARFQRSY